MQYRINNPLLEIIRKNYFQRWFFIMQRNKKKIAIILLAITIISFLSYNIFLKENTNSVEALSKYGSRGEEVRTIQTKLKRWGYYSGSVDGIYGSKTLAAVKWFQSKNGLSVDGIAGPKTLAAMGINTSSSSSSASSNTSDLNLLARLVYAEARGESYTRTSRSCSSSIK